MDLSAEEVDVLAVAGAMARLSNPEDYDAEELREAEALLREKGLIS